MGRGIGIGIAVTIAVIAIIAAIGALMIFICMRRNAKRRREMEQRKESDTNQFGVLENQRPRRRTSLFGENAMAIVEWRTRSREATEPPQIYLHSPLGIESRSGETISSHESNIFRA